LVFQAGTGDVRDVFVDGRAVKRDGKLVGFDLAALTRRADDASDRILQRIADAGTSLPGTPPGAMEALEPMFEQNMAGAIKP
jgi:hypothetical protein